MTVKMTTETIPKIGRVVQFHRKEAGLSRIELANIAGVGKTVVYDIENGKETVRLNTLLKVLGALNVSISLSSPLMNRFEVGDDAEG